MSEHIEENLSENTNELTDMYEKLVRLRKKQDASFKSDTPIKNKQYIETIETREEQDKLFNLINTPLITRSEARKIIENQDKTINNKTTLKNKMLMTRYDNRFSKQGEFINVPLNFHEGYTNSNFKYIFKADTNNLKLYNTDDVIWENGLICSNRNTIVVRDKDNNWGKNGFLQGVFFSDYLSVDIMNKYLIPYLKSEVINKNINCTSNPDEIRKNITDKYNNIYKEKINMLESSDMTIEKLYADLHGDNDEVEICNPVMTIIIGYITSIFNDIKDRIFNFFSW
jgi:hypothetical protein